MSSGRIERAWFLTTGTMRAPAAAFALDGETSTGGVRGLLSGAVARLSRGWVSFPVAVLVLEHAPLGTGDVTLVDTGWSAAQCASPRRELGATGLFLGVRLSAGDDAVTQLRRKGIERARVKTIIATHLHNDHVGGLVDFPDAEVVTSDAELASARERGFLHGFDVEALARVGRFRMARFEGKAVHEFPASSALDELTLLDARGHTAGSLAVVLSLADTTLVHLGDAAYTMAEAMAEEQSALAKRTSWDLERQKTTYRSIARLSHDRAVTLVTSHDPITWARVEGRTFSR